MQLLILNLLIVFYTHSGIPRLIRKAIWTILFKDVPFKEDFLMQPLGCSLCLGFWLGMFSLFWLGFTPFNVIYVLLLAYYNDLIWDFLGLVKDLTVKVINCIYRFID